MSAFLIAFLYLVASGLAVAGLWMLTVPNRAQQGPLFMGAGLLLAALVTLPADGVRESVGVAMTGLALGGCGAFLGLRVSNEKLPARLALIVAAAGLATALTAMVDLQTAGRKIADQRAEFDEQWKGIPDKIRELNAQPSVLPIPLRHSFPASMATALGGLVASAAGISFLKLAKSPLRKSLPKLEDPMMPQIAIILVCALLALLFCAWPTRGTFLWLLLFAGMSLGYVLTIHLKIVDVPPVLAAVVGILGLSLAAAGLVLGNIMIVTLSALVTSGGAVLAKSLCSGLSVSLPGLIRGTESSKSITANEAEPAPPPKPKAPTIVGPDPDAPIL
ncbi:MAG TPA: NAD(P)(+) transhydrogenase (Re/Si-specific) subunit beta [Caulifigura sp.]|nr:NAD(P)(+) transhydrogenase (Re/Si-specific) subunit beta [Caulifigura sp.]